MSGSTIGGVVGGVIGFVVSGFNPAGAQWGFMIGSAIGGYLDPAQVQGPRITDAQAQTSNEGVPRTIVYGTCAVAGNIIQVGPLIEHKRVESQGKGGPEVTTFTYTRTVAIRICEAAPLGGKMVLRRVWKDDKLVYDASAGTTMDADSQKFASILTFYSGGVDQLPDPSLESLPAEYGGGVGNVPAYRSSCYAVLTDLDCTNREGSVSQFRWEVCSDATEEPLPGPTVGAETITATMDGQSPPAYIGYGGSGVTFMSGVFVLDPSETYTVGSYNDDLEIASSSTIEYVNPYPFPSDLRWKPIASKGAWALGEHANAGFCELLQNGERAAFLVPTELQIGAGWWYGEAGFYPEYGGLCWFDSSSVYLGVRKVGNGDGVTYNIIYKWPLENIGSDWQLATAISPVVTAGSHFYMHMDRSGTVYAIARTESELVTYDAGLSEASRESLPMELSGVRAFAVDSGMLILLIDTVLHFYDLDTFTLQQSVALSGTFASVNNQIICTDDSIFIRSGVNLKRVAFAPSCYIAAPEGWYDLPDTPNAFTNGTDIMPRCGAPYTVVTPGKVSLPAVVADIASRVGIEASQLDLSSLDGKEVRGYPIARETTADAAALELMRIFFFELPEWGNSGDSGTKLRSVLRGGASVLTLTDDDLAGDGDDELTRPQQLEFPRKISLTAPDPDANYEPSTEPAERESENVKAVGEERTSTAVVLSRDENAATVDKLLKTAEANSVGRIQRTVPKKFSHYTPSDCLQYQDKRYRIDQATLRGDTIDWELTRDRISAASSSATGSTPQTPTTPVSSIRGPTIFAAMNLPSLRSADNVPGMYLAAQGLLPGWAGADIYLSVDGGATEQKVATILNAATMGALGQDCTDSSEPIVVQLYNGGELDSITDDQMDARLNGFAIGMEVGQFKTATETGNLLYELTDVLRGELDTDAVGHDAGDTFVLLDQGVVFLPIDAMHAGKTLIFRAVSIGTFAVNNPTTSVVFDPPVFIIDGGTTL